jgi:predicted MFS family arabinose efflux permease
MYLNDVCTNENRARVLGAQLSAMQFGFALGPAVGGVLGNSLGLVAPFLAVSGAGGLAALYAFARIPESLPLLTSGGSSTGGHKDRSSVRGDDTAVGDQPAQHGAEERGSSPRGTGEFAAASTLLTDRRFLAAGLMNFSSFAVRQGGRHVLLVLYAVGVHDFTVGQLGVLFSAMAACDLLLIPAAAAVADAVGPDRRMVVVPSALGCAASLAAIGLGGADPVVFGGAMCLWSLSTAAVGPGVAAYAAEVVPSERRGLGTALYRTAGDLGGLTVPLACGLAVDAFGSPDVPLVLLAIMTVGCASTFAVSGLPPCSSQFSNKTDQN